LFEKKSWLWKCELSRSSGSDEKECHPAESRKDTFYESFYEMAPRMDFNRLKKELLID
jgi:hypothetical protein